MLSLLLVSVCGLDGASVMPMLTNSLGKLYMLLTTVLYVFYVYKHMLPI